MRASGDGEVDRVKKLHPLAVFARAARGAPGAGDQRPLGVAGARELVPLLARELRAGGEAAAVVEGRLEGAAALVWLGGADEERLRAASKGRRADRRASRDGRAPALRPRRPTSSACRRARASRSRRSPRALARRLGEDGTALAARLPVLRPAVCDELIGSFAKRNGLIAAAIFVPGVDLPVLTLNQIRLVLRIALAYGRRRRPRARARAARRRRRSASVSARSRGSCSTSCRSPAGRSRAASPTRARRRSARLPCATSRRAGRRGPSGPGPRLSSTPTGGDRMALTRTPGSDRALTDRGSGRLVRVPRGDQGPVRRAATSRSSRGRGRACRSGCARSARAAASSRPPPKRPEPERAHGSR